MTGLLSVVLGCIGNGGETLSTLRSTSADSIHIHSQVCPSASFLASGAVPAWPGMAQDFNHVVIWVQPRGRAARRCGRPSSRKAYWWWNVGAASAAVDAPRFVNWQQLGRRVTAARRTSRTVP